MSYPPSPTPREPRTESVTTSFDAISVKQAAERTKLLDEMNSVVPTEVISPDQIVKEALEELNTDQEVHVGELPSTITGIHRRDQIVLDPSDPVEAVLIKMVELNRRKRADYAADGDPFSNFRRTAERMAKRFPGFSPLDAVEFNIDQKEERLIALHENGRVPSNESVTDTYFDRAVYSAIAVALSMEQES